MGEWGGNCCLLGMSLIVSLMQPYKVVRGHQFQWVLEW